VILLSDAYSDSGSPSDPTRPISMGRYAIYGGQPCHHTPWLNIQCFDVAENPARLRYVNLVLRTHTCQPVAFKDKAMATRISGAHSSWANGMGGEMSALRFDLARVKIRTTTTQGQPQWFDVLVGQIHCRLKAHWLSISHGKCHNSAYLH
jgi:hypothetical protein